MYIYAENILTFHLIKNYCLTKHRFISILAHYFNRSFAIFNIYQERL